MRHLILHGCQIRSNVWWSVWQRMFKCVLYMLYLSKATPIALNYFICYKCHSIVWKLLKNFASQNFCLIWHPCNNQHIDWLIAYFIYMNAVFWLLQLTTECHKACLNMNVYNFSTSNPHPTSWPVQPVALRSERLVRKPQQSCRLHLHPGLFWRSIRCMPTGMHNQRGLSVDTCLQEPALCWPLSWLVWGQRAVQGHQPYCYLHVYWGIRWRSLLHL